MDLMEMMLVQRRMDREPKTTDQPTAPLDDPLLRLQEELQEPDTPGYSRSVLHPHELTITGIIVMCPACGARRDWLIICDGSRVSIRCRCAHQWAEPEISHADFDAMISGPGTNYTNFTAAVRATGYDGTLAGTYLP
ncbi:hypothetical protein [Streptomyces silvisoli]|uniref:Uncharacterized protein n=1 Tax=Streptomyces silvisoli TaxID=3034235 RepID=A0ABT5ZQ05_9ACTN|nr:hypothetical protein [Streptomyces silvisoli]MDF3291902.1 hypothetical protein [Streptomyces silvisoli]